MIASFEQYLKREKHFEKNRKTWQSKQEQLQKQRRGNKQKVYVSSAEKQMKVLYNRTFLKSQVQKRFSTLWLNNSLHFSLQLIQEHHNLC